MANLTTLLVSHKGVDLHAATAVRVMQKRLDSGDALQALHRAEVHVFWGEGNGRSVSDLLGIGRYFNPNKHHYGHFEVAEAGDRWTDQELLGGRPLEAAWPGQTLGSDLGDDSALLADTLLGGPLPADHVAVDMLAFPLGEDDPLRSGVLWRLVLADDGRDPVRLAERLAVARSSDQGLLINPHLHGWLTRVWRP